MARKSTRKTFEKYVPFTGRMVMLGFGSIGQGVLPLILRHIAIKPSQITIIAGCAHRHRDTVVTSNALMHSSNSNFERFFHRKRVRRHFLLRPGKSRHRDLNHAASHSRTMIHNEDRLCACVRCYTR